jgi:hypothetical protein
MDFAEAADLAHSIEVAAKTEGMTAFNALVDELLEAQADAPPWVTAGHCFCGNRAKGL